MVIALLPARNAARHLDRYLACAEKIVDGVVALDDGSTDDTADRLRASPLVRTLLQNPPRESYAGWDDAGNRQRLLTAAASCNPTWILQLDADEEIAGSDARLFRELVQQPGPDHVSYSFQTHRMLDPDGLTYDKCNLWLHRLFCPIPGMRLPAPRLHLEPVPRCIPVPRRVKTNIRIRHFSGVTSVDRKARFDKYLEADPGNRFQASYQSILDDPGTVQGWTEHPDDVRPIVDPERYAVIERSRHLCLACSSRRIFRRFGRA